VRRFLDAYGTISDGTITRWLPAAQGEPALWHMTHEDGDQEDLEAHEVRAAMRAYKLGLQHDDGADGEGAEGASAMEDEDEEVEVADTSADGDVEHVLARRYAPGSLASGRPKIEYLIKWKGRSYLHVAWRTESALTRKEPKVLLRLKAFNKSAPPLPPLPSKAEEVTPMESLLERSAKPTPPVEALAAPPLAEEATSPPAAVEDASMPDVQEPVADAQHDASAATPSETAPYRAQAELGFAPFPVVVPLETLTGPGDAPSELQGGDPSEQSASEQRAAAEAKRGRPVAELLAQVAVSPAVKEAAAARRRVAGAERCEGDDLLPPFDTLGLLPKGVVHVEAVLSMRERRGVPELLIKWAGLPYAEASWEVDGTFDGGLAPALVAYEAACAAPCVPDAAKTRDARPAKLAPLSRSPKYADGRQLRAYQLEGVNWMLQSWQQKRNVMLADEMGALMTSDDL
jgi:hypothetical protein